MAKRKPSTPEQRAIYNANRRMKYAKLSPEEKETIRAKVRCYHNKHREEINTNSRLDRKLNPDRYKKYYLNVREKKRAYKQKYKLKYRLLAAEYNDKIKLDAISHYSPEVKCVNCGITDIDVLTIDHINGHGTQHRKHIIKGGGIKFYYWLRYNNYPDGYRVLCFNCNWKAHIQKLRGNLLKELMVNGRN